MDPMKIEKIQAINKYKKHQPTNKLFLYCLTILTSSLLCSSPYWFPSCSSIRVFLFVSLPKISAFLVSSKFLFIIGNLIVIILLGESKIFASDSSPASDVYYNEYVKRSRSIRNSYAFEDKNGRKLEVSFSERVKRTCEGEENIERKGWEQKKVVEKKNECLHEEELNLPAEDLNKRADDFIARVNKQRRLEAELVDCSNE